MHIVHCLTNSTIGGGQQVVYLLARSFLKKYPNTQQTIVLPSGGIYVERFKNLGLKVIEFPFNIISFRNFFEISHLIKELKPDIVHTHGKGAGLYVRLISKDSIKFKNVHSYHGFHPPRRFIYKKVYLLLESFLLKRTDCTVYVSESEKELVRKHFNFCDDRSIVIKNVIDKEIILEESKFEIPQKINDFLKSPQNKFIVIMIGRNDYIKNFPLAIETARIAMRMRQTIAFLFVGLDEDDKIIYPLIREFPNRVMATGIVRNTPPLIKNSHLLLITSRREAFPLVIIEAHTLGKPVVGVRVPGIIENIKHYENGILCDESPKSLADAIGILESDKQLYEQMQRNALRAAAMMDVDKWVEHYQELYLNLCR